MISSDNINAVALFSDGFERLTERYDALAYEMLFETVQEEGPKPLFDELRRIEREDESCEMYPRTKPRDDAALLIVDL